MKISKQEVEEWIKDPDLVAGSTLLKKINPNHRSNDIRAIGAKLCYYVRIHLPNPFPPKKLPTPDSELPTPDSELPTPDSELPTPDSQLPTPNFIERIIKEHTHLVQLRSQLADDRLKIPEASTPNNNKARKILSESIHQHSQRIEAIWQAKEDYFTKNIQPDMELLFPGEKPKQVLDEKDLRAKLHSLKSLQKKYENMLKYQELSVQKKENPMPSGPKREKLEARIKNLSNKITEIKKQIPV